jgi:hypothetical protein
VKRFKINYTRGDADYVDADRYLRLGGVINFYRDDNVVFDVSTRDVRSIAVVDEDEGRGLGFA